MAKNRHEKCLLPIKESNIKHITSRFMVGEDFNIQIILLM